MRFVEELRKSVRSLVELPGIGGVFAYVNTTPAFEIVTYVIPDSHGRLVVLARRGDFDPRLTTRLITRVRSLANEDPVIDLIKCCDAQVDPFQQIVFVGPAAHNMFGTYSRELKDHTIVAFPSYRCEFTGTESAETIKLLRRDFIDTLDWGRQPSPQLRLRYDNETAGLGSQSNKLGWASVDAVKEVTESFEGGIGICEIENFQHHVLRVNAHDGNFNILIDGSQIHDQVGYAEMADAVKRFVFIGVRKEG